LHCGAYAGSCGMAVVHSQRYCSSDMISATWSYVKLAHEGFTDANILVCRVYAGPCHKGPVLSYTPEKPIFFLYIRFMGMYMGGVQRSVSRAHTNPNALGLVPLDRQSYRACFVAQLCPYIVFSCFNAMPKFCCFIGTALNGYPTWCHSPNKHT
jgi:hypothetical protein